MEFFNSAVDVLKTLVVALGAGLGVWGAVNLMEGYGGDNPSAKLHVGVVQCLAGAGPTHRLYDVDALTQQVQPDGVGKHMVVLQNRDAVLDRPLNFTIGVLGKHFLYVCNGSGSAFFVDFFAQ